MQIYPITRVCIIIGVGCSVIKRGVDTMSQSNLTQHEIDVYCAQWILNGGDQSKAWRKAYPNSTADDKTIWEKAARMHAMSKVQTRLAELQAETAAKDAEEFDMSVSELKEKLKAVIDAGLAGRVDSEGNSSPANLGATVSAIAEFNRMSGNHATVKSITANVDLAGLSDDELDAKIRALTE